MEEKRAEVRRRMKMDAKDLCSLVVGTACEYKEELMKLEEENNSLKSKIRHVKDINKNLQEQNENLLEEFHKAQKRIRKLIKKFGKKKLCYNCDHLIDCNYSLCVYCQKWMCECCVNICDYNKQDEVKHGEFKCHTLICNSCYNTHPLCPEHHYTPLSNELLQYYLENRFKKL